MEFHVILRDSRNFQTGNFHWVYKIHELQVVYESFEFWVGPIYSHTLKLNKVTQSFAHVEKFTFSLSQWFISHNSIEHPTNYCPQTQSNKHTEK